MNKNDPNVNEKANRFFFFRGLISKTGKHHVGPYDTHLYLLDQLSFAIILVGRGIKDAQ